MKYKVVYAQGAEFAEVAQELNQKVAELLKKGWVPQGGVAQSVTEYEWYHMSQALIKTSDENESYKNIEVI